MFQERGDPLRTLQTPVTPLSQFLPRLQRIAVDSDIETFNQNYVYQAKVHCTNFVSWLIDVLRRYTPLPRNEVKIQL